MKFNDIQLTPQNRVTQCTYKNKKYNFYSKGAWEQVAFMMPPANWIREKRSKKEIMALMSEAVINGQAKPYPSINSL